MNLIYRQKIRKVNKIKYIIKGSKRSEIKDYISGKLIRDFELYIEYKIKKALREQSLFYVVCDGISSAA